jgi:hypothetical protein
MLLPVHKSSSDGSKVNGLTGMGKASIVLLVWMDLDIPRAILCISWADPAIGRTR